MNNFLKIWAQPQYRSFAENSSFGGLVSATCLVVT
jgi:hypothetical protein